MRINKFKSFHNESISNTGTTREEFRQRCNYTEEQLIELGHIFNELSDCGIQCYLYIDSDDYNEDEAFITAYNYDDDNIIISNDQFVGLCNQVVDRLKITYGEHRSNYDSYVCWGTFSYDSGFHYGEDSCCIKDIDDVKHEEIYHYTFNIENLNN